MPIKTILLAIFLLISYSLYAQKPIAELIEFNQARLQTNKIGMLTLGSWALINIGTGVTFSRQATGSNKYFHQMNTYWNFVNLALAGFGFYGSITTDPTTFNLFSSIKEHYSMEKLLLLNAGLDIGYITTGLYLAERAKNSAKHTDRLRGFGQSIMLQGGFLLLFDTTLYFIHHSHIRLIKNILSNVSFTNNSVSVVVNF